MKSFEEVMKLTKTVSSETALDDQEAKALYDYCMAVPKNGSVVEIGCQLGRSSSLILQVAKEREFQSSHIDPYIDDPEYLPQWITMMHSIGYPFMFICAKSSLVAANMPVDELPVDLLFVDGDHEYKSVADDLWLFAGSVVKGGILAMHDYNRESLPGVTAAANLYLVEDLWDLIGVYGTLGVWRRR